MKVKIIKYEDLLNNTEKTFINILEFLNTFTPIKIDKKRLEKVVSSTDFNNLQTKEEQLGFEESITSKKNNKKIKFFNLGKKNNWKKILDPKIEKKITNLFQQELKELNYIIN